MKKTNGNGVYDVYKPGVQLHCLQPAEGIATIRPAAMREKGDGRAQEQQRVRGNVKIRTMVIASGFYFWLYLCLALLPSGGGERGVVYRQLFPMGARGEEPVVSNVTSLRLDTADTGDTGWIMQMEAAFTRDPPVYGERDESMDLGCLIMLYKRKGETRKAPLKVGTIVKGRIYLQSIHSSDVEWKPLVNFADQDDMLMANLHIMLGMHDLQRKTIADARIYGPLTITVVLDLQNFGTLSAQVTTARSPLRIFNVLSLVLLLLLLQCVVAGTTTTTTTASMCCRWYYYYYYCYCSLTLENFRVSEQ